MAIFFACDQNPVLYFLVFEKGNFVNPNLYVWIWSNIDGKYTDN